MILESKKIDFEEVDISTNSELKDKMRDIAGSPQAMPPQIARGKTYLGVSMQLNDQLILA